MQSDIIVILPPAFNNFSGLGYCFEPMLVKALIAKPAVKTFCKTVLHGFSRINEDMINLLFISPMVHRIACKFGAVIRQNFFRNTSECMCYTKNSKHPYFKPFSHLLLYPCYCALNMPCIEKYFKRLPSNLKLYAGENAHPCLMPNDYPIEKIVFRFKHR